jgi:hypothetical protein
MQEALKETQNAEYEAQLDAHIAWLNQEIDKASAFKHKREQYMYGKTYKELLEIHGKFVDKINDDTLKEKAVRHMEYATHFLKEHNVDKWTNVLVPAIASWYCEQAKST